MKILFSGHDFKYETEATVKLFIPSRFTFHYDITDADGDIVQKLYLFVCLLPYRQELLPQSFSYS